MGGNPACIPEMEALFKQRLESIANDSRLLSTLMAFISLLRAS